MKKIILLLIIYGLFCKDAYSQYGQADYSALAKKIVNNTARVKPGDLVLIGGGIHTFPLMEQIAVEVNRLGGMTEVIVNSDAILTSYYKERPDAHIRYPKYLPVFYGQADIIISLPMSQDFQKVFADIPPERMAQFRQFEEQAGQELAKQHFSFVQLNYPTKESATADNIDFATLEKIHWDAMNADYSAIEEKGKKLIEILKNAKNVKITTPAGTQLSFTIGSSRKVFKDDGILSDEEKNSKDYFARFASLPGGFIDFAPVEKSVNGKVVVPRNKCQFKPFNNISFTVKDGLVENLNAKEGFDCYKKEMAPFSDEKMIVSIFTIGLNPGYKVIEDSGDYRPRNAAGFVQLGIGGNNEFYGGEIRSKGSYTFPLTNATVEADGKVLIKDGKLL